MLEDTSIQHLISWSKKGDQFNVPNPTTFSRTVLPQYFKHSNWQSFIRQLNSKSIERNWMNLDNYLLTRDHLKSVWLS